MNVCDAKSSDTRKIPLEAKIDLLDVLESRKDDVGPLGYCDGADLAFSDIRYRVPSLKGGKVEVLKGVSGTCGSGRLLALMGASGRSALATCRRPRLQDASN